MKTKLTFLGVVSPFISLAQMGGGGGEIISVLIVLERRERFKKRKLKKMDIQNAELPLHQFLPLE